MEITRRLTEEKQQQKRRARFVRYGAIAAAILLVVGGTMGMLLREGMLGKKDAQAPMMAASGATSSEAAVIGKTANDAAAPEETALTAAMADTDGAVQSYDELYDLIEGLTGQRGAKTALSAGVATDEAVTFDTAAPAAPEPVPANSAAAEMPASDSGAAYGKGSGEYSETNVQVAGVDEADIVKTDGEYIYYIVENRLMILKADGADTKLVSVTEFGDRDDWWAYASEMYLLGDRLMILSQGHAVIWVQSGQNTYESGQQQTVATVYDISDRAKPREVTSLGQSGAYVSSRMVGGYVYVVTSQYLYNIVRSAPATYVPQLITDGKSDSVAVADIYVYDDPKDAAYTVISGFDLAKGTAHTSAKAVFGCTGTVYANTEHLLLAANEYEEETAPIAPDKDGRNVQITTSSNSTKLMLFSLENGRVTRLARGKVKGALINQFAMDEYKGAFRLVTTVNDWETRIYTDGVDTYEYEDSTYNCLYTLDGKLEPLGELTDLAEDEWVESVRFDGDIAYFVTFRQTDPLFTVDVSDPAHPKLLGALKIPGFSEYLHVFTEGRLFGLGYHADEKTGWTSCVKLSMFDTTNKRSVLEKTTLQLDADYTMVGQNHKAILIDAARDLIAFPADNSYYIFGYSDEKGFVEKTTVSIRDAWSWNLRGLFIGEHFYVLSEGRVLVLSLADFSQLASVKLP